MNSEYYIKKNLWDLNNRIKEVLWGSGNAACTYITLTEIQINILPVTTCITYSSSTIKHLSNPELSTSASSNLMMQLDFPYVISYWCLTETHVLTPLLRKTQAFKM